ncbi:acyltransferase [Bifidobacterium sp. UTBIF-78]|uniref:acyltransferase n=1 Tax=Bifidobacterium sp. UTBIF-78 TaxID=1465263 RepID=UPI001128EC36|nr:acyltransferase [Bifidobacterium sp. UTBIF-78]TPF92107.1 hypothetical protein BG22_09960 [Bifidobacterium sp. UTBIF-78]
MNLHEPTAHYSRDVGIDVIRALAIFCVIGIHSLPQTVPLSLGVGREHATIIMRLLTQFVQMTCQLGVPLFLAITGYLMLGRDYTGLNLERFVKRNLLPVFVSFEFWNLVMCGVRQFGIAHDVTLTEVVKSALFLSQPPMGHIWYLQMIVGTYCALPLLAMALRKVEETHTERYLLFFIAMIVVYRSVAPTAEKLMEIAGRPIHIEIAYDSIVSDLAYTFVPLLIGYAIRRGLFAHMRFSTVVVLLVASFVALIGEGYFWLMNGPVGKPQLPEYAVNDVFLAFAVLMTFAIIHRVIGKDNPLPRQVVVILGRFSQYIYGIYIFHFPIIWKLAFFWHPTNHNWLNFVIYSVAAFVPSLAATIILSRVPIVGHWLLLTKMPVRHRESQGRHRAR